MGPLLRPARSRSSTARPPSARPSTRRTGTGFFIINYEQLIRDLEIDPPLGARPRRARRGAADQELGDEDGALGQGADPALPPGADRHADGEPDRGAGLDRRVGRRHGARAQVAAGRRCTRSAPTAAARSSASATSTRSATGSGGCMVRRVRQDVLDQLPPRTDVRVPIELTEPQLEEHDALIQPIVALVQRAQGPAADAGRVPPPDEPADDPADHLQRPGPASTSRRSGRRSARCDARGERDRGPLVAQAAGAPPARPPDRARAGPQGRHLQPVAADAHPGALGGERPARRATASAPASSPGPRGRSGGPRTSSSSTTTRTSASSSPATPGGVGLNLQHAANCVINLELPWNPAVLEQRIGRIYRLGQKQADRRLQPRLRAGDRVADRRPRRLEAGVLQGPLRRRQRLGPVRPVRLVPVAGREALRAGRGREPRPRRRTPTAIEEPADTDLDLDDEVADPFEPLIEAADESEDRAAVLAPDAASRPLAVPEPSPRRRRHPAAAAAAGRRPPALLAASDPPRDGRQGRDRGPGRGGLGPRRPVRGDGRADAIGGDAAGRPGPGVGSITRRSTSSLRARPRSRWTGATRPARVGASRSYIWPRIKTNDEPRSARLSHETSTVRSASRRFNGSYSKRWSRRSSIKRMASLYLGWLPGTAARSRSRR